MMRHGKTKAELIEELNALRERMGAELQQAQREWEDIFQAIGHPTLILDKDYRILTANRAVVRAVGMAAEKLQGKKCHEVFHGSGEPPEGCPMERMLQSAHLETVEMEIEALGGVFLVSCTPMLDEEGNLQRIIHIAMDITERKQMETALRMTQFAVDCASVGVFWLDPKGRFLYVNEAACRKLGYSREEMLRMTVHDIDPGFPEEVWPRHWEELKQHGALTFESRHRRKDGSIFPVEITINYLEFNGKEYNFAFTQDITERRRAEELIESERDLGMELGRASSLGEALSHCLASAIRVSGMDCGGVYLVDENDGSLNLVAHKGLSDAFVTSASHFAGDSDSARLVKKGEPIYAQHQDTDIGLADSRRREGLKAIAVMPVRYRNEIVAYVHVASHRLEEVPASARTALEAIMSRIGVSIAHSKQQEALRQSEEKYRGIFDESLAAVYVFDAEKNFIDSNQAGLDLLGYSRDELLNMSIPDVDANSEVVLPAHRQLLSGERIINYEHQLKRKDGRIITVLNNSRPITGADGSVVGMQSTLIDITERRQLQQQLFQAQKLESVGILAGGVAHNFNNILGAILGNVELASLNLGAPDDAGRLLEKAAQACKRGAQLTGQLLSFSRRESSKKVSVRVSDLLKGVLQALGVMLDANIQMKCRIPDDALCILANHAEMEQVLMNLCLNAQDAMPKGGLLALGADLVDRSPEDCQAHEQMEPGRYVRISVRDTGMGMDDETLSRVFDPFFTTKGPDRGTGLGLSATYQTVVNHGGCIEVESEEGKGTTFTIYLPAGMKPEEEAPGRGEAEFLKGSETILIVDDEEMVLDMARESLEALGYTALTAKSGKDAISIYRGEQNHIVLILLDYMMPEMGGEDVYRELKKINPRVKVIVASGYDERSKLKPLLDAGVDRFIQKPYSLSELSQVVRGALDKPPQEAQAL